MPQLNRIGSFFKVDIELVFKTLQRKHDQNYLDMFAFFEAIEILSQKVYKDGSSLGEKVRMLLEDSLAYFEYTNSVDEVKPA